MLFDLDGVITDTAAIHRACWKETFDAYLLARAEAHGERFRPFDEEDYLRYVDGRPRYDGVRAFLASRGIELPEGDPSDAADAETVCGLGNRKNDRVGPAITEKGVDVFPGSLAWLEQLRAAGFRTALVSASANAATVLEVTGLLDAFEVRVDGCVLAAEGIAGKPAPDSFLEAARRLGVPPERAVVVEDARSGVEAGRAGSFGLVIGVARHGDAAALRDAGADRVVDDLGELVA
ncbi:MAG: HAD family hydrolase [Myxococcota bacterium]